MTAAPCSPSIHWMGHSLEAAPKAPWFSHAGRLVVTLASTGAAVASILSGLYTFGVVGNAESHRTIANRGAAWVGVHPAADTATAIADTVHLAATVTDKNGSVLVGARPTWATDDSAVASVLQDGSVVAKRAGVATINIVIGGLIARARVVVKPHVATVEMTAGGADSAFSLLEGARLPLRARGLDARGHAVAGAGAGVTWLVADSTIATLDSGANLVGRNAGQTVVSAAIEGIVTRRTITVAAAPAAITTIAGTNQHAFAGSALPLSIVVRVTNRHGRPLEGQSVAFRLADAQGSVDPPLARSDADGRVRTTWKLGDVPGKQKLIAVVDHLDSALVVSAEADPVAGNTRIVALGDSLAAFAGHALGETAGIRLTDSTGHILADVPVAWTVMDGGSVEPVGMRTDSAGEARVHWTLGSRIGRQRLRLQVGVARGAQSVAPATIVAIARAGAPAKLVLVKGDAQHAAAGSPLAKEIVVRILDAHGNGVADAPLGISPSSGSVPDSAPLADSSGAVRIRWTAGRVAGKQKLALRTAGVKQRLDVAAVVNAGRAANLSFTEVKAHRKSAHATVKQLTAVVSDVYGNPVGDANVRFSSQSGSVTPSRAVSDSRGRIAVTWRLAATRREQTITGTVRGTDVTGRYVVTGR